MRAVFSIGALLVVAAIVAVVAKKQLQAVGSPSPATAGGSTSGQPQSPGQVQALPKQVQQDVENALRQGEARASEAAP